MQSISVWRIYERIPAPNLLSRNLETQPRGHLVPRRSTGSREFIFSRKPGDSLIIAAFLLRPVSHCIGPKVAAQKIVTWSEGWTRSTVEGGGAVRGSVVVSACTECRKRDPWIIVFAARRERRDRNGGHKSLERLSLNVIGSRPIGVVHRRCSRSSGLAARRKFSFFSVKIERRPEIVDQRSARASVYAISKGIEEPRGVRKRSGGGESEGSGERANSVRAIRSGRVTSFRSIAVRSTKL